jgi:flagellar basal body rod protein FlgG
LPPDATGIRVGPDGVVTFVVPQDERRHPAGTIMLFGFMNPDAVEQRGECLFAETAGSGPAFLLEPGVNGCGELRQGFLEQSNVDLESELAELMRLRKLSQALHAAVQLIEPVHDEEPSHPSAELNVAVQPDGAAGIAPQLATEAAETATDTAQQ